MAEAFLTSFPGVLPWLEPVGANGQRKFTCQGSLSMGLADSPQSPVVAVNSQERILDVIAPGVPMSEANRRHWRPHYGEAMGHLRELGVLLTGDTHCIMMR